MKRHSWLVLPILCAALCVAEQSPSKSLDGLELLKRAAQHYANAKSYNIESVMDLSDENDLHRSWGRTIMHAAESSGGRYHFEGRSWTDSASRISDGKSVWTFNALEKRYTTNPVREKSPDEPQQEFIGMFGASLINAEHTRQLLADLTKEINSAQRLHDGSVKADGKKFDCYVVLVREQDRKRHSSGNSSDETIWIDKKQELVRKISRKASTYLFTGTARLPMQQEIVTTYSRVELDQPLPDDLFRFSPPADAKLIDHFPDPRTETFGPSLTGEPAPALQLKDTEGKTVSLSSFQGKPVLIDVWATWCQPCVQTMPQIAKIFEESRSKGLVLLSIDRDEDANKASEFMSKKNYKWQNFHDDGWLEKVVPMMGIPRILLINADGKVVYDSTGTNEQAVREAISKLGPEYASVAKTPAKPGCE